MNKNLAKTAEENGYKKNLCQYLLNGNYVGSTDVLFDAIKRQETEKEILTLSFAVPVIDYVEIFLPSRNKESGDYGENASRAEAEQKYLSHCNLDGSFRYEDFIN